MPLLSRLRGGPRRFCAPLSSPKKGGARVMTKTNYISASVALLAALLAASLLVLVLPKVASSQVVVTEKEIDSNGKLGSIWVNNQLGCQVDHSGNGAGGEFYNGVLTTVEATDDYVTCGTWIGVLGGSTFGVEYGE